MREDPLYYPNQPTSSSLFIRQMITHSNGHLAAYPPQLHPPICQDPTLDVPEVGPVSDQPPRDYVTIRIRTFFTSRKHPPLPFLFPTVHCGPAREGLRVFHSRVSAVGCRAIILLHISASVNEPFTEELYCFFFACWGIARSGCIDFSWPRLGLLTNDINPPLAFAILEPIFNHLGLKGPLLMESFSKNVNPVIGMVDCEKVKGIIWLVMAVVAIPDIDSSNGAALWVI